jgi:hypothetical protein
LGSAQQQVLIDKIDQIEKPSVFLTNTRNVMKVGLSNKVMHSQKVLKELKPEASTLFENKTINYLHSASNKKIVKQMKTIEPKVIQPSEKMNSSGGALKKK